MWRFQTYMQKRQSILRCFRGYLPILLQNFIKPSPFPIFICSLICYSGFFLSSRFSRSSRFVRFFRFFHCSRCCNDSSCRLSASELCCCSAYLCFSSFHPSSILFCSHSLFLCEEISGFVFYTN